MPDSSQEIVARDSGPVRAAALLEMLGKEPSAEIVQRLAPPQVARLADAFARLKHMQYAERRRLAEEGWKQLAASAAQPDVVEFAREVLNSCLGPEEAEKLLSGRLGRRATSLLLDWVPESSAQELASGIAEENPRVMAIVLAALRPTVAARVLSLLRPEAQGEAMLALSRPAGPEPEAVAAIVQAVARLAEAVGGPEATGGSFGGPSLMIGTGKVAEIVRQCDRHTERSIIEYLQEHAPEIAQEVSQASFTRMEDLRWLDARSLQLVIRQVDQKELALALRGAAESVRQLCLENLSENAAASLKEEVESLGPRPRRQVETAQQGILQTVRDMLDADRIQIADDGDLV
jgi:flagellar motor switch protein FliG